MVTQPRKFDRPTVFVAASSDVSAERDLAIRTISRLCRPYAGRIAPYCWLDERYPDSAKTWQDNIGSPADPAVVVTVCILGERVGVAIPQIRRLGHVDYAALRDFVRDNDLPVDVDGTGVGVPLTGTLYELLEALRVGGPGSGRSSSLLIFVKGDARALDPSLSREQRQLGFGAHHRRLALAAGGQLSEEEEIAYARQVEWLSEVHTGIIQKLQLPYVLFADDEALEVSLRDSVHKALYGAPYGAVESAFPGVMPYNIDAATAFRGRGAEIDAIVDQFSQAGSPTSSHTKPIVALHGPSGVGKSSLAIAGVGGQLRGPRGPYGKSALVVTLSPENPLARGDRETFDASPLEVIVSAIADQAGIPSLSAALVQAEKPLSLEAGLMLCRAHLGSALGPNGLLYIVLDQSERMLIRRDPATGQYIQSATLDRSWGDALRFLHGLAGPVDQTRSDGPAVWVALTLANEEAKGRKSALALLRASSVVAEIERAHSPFMYYPVSEPTGQLRVIATDTFSFAALPQLTEAVLEAIERRIEAWRKESRGGSVLPLFAALLQHLSVIAEDKKLRSLRGAANQQELFLELSDVEEDLNLADVIDRLAEGAEARLIASPAFADHASKAAPGGDDADNAQTLLNLTRTRFLRGIVRLAVQLPESEEQLDDVDHAGGDFAPEPDVRIAYFASGTPENLMAQALVDARLAFRIGQEYFSLAHASVLVQWRSAQSWMREERGLLELRSQIQVQRLAKGKLSAPAALRGAALLAAWRDDAEALSKVERDVLVASLVANLAAYSRSERSAVFRIGLLLAENALVEPCLRLAKRQSLATTFDLDERGPESWAMPIPAFAARAGRFDIVDAALEAGCDVLAGDRAGTCLIHELSRARDHRRLKRALDALPRSARRRGANLPQGEQWRRPLHLAALTSARDAADESAAALTMRELLSAGANPRYTTWPFNRTSLHYTALNGLTAAARILLDADPSLLQSVNQEHQTPLHFAALSGHAELVSEIVARCAEASFLNLRDDAGDAPGFGRTALFSAAANGHLAVVRILIEAGADLSIVTHSGVSCLFAAARRGRADVVFFLIEQMRKTGGHPWSPDRNGRTLLHVAAGAGQVDLLQRLLLDAEASGVLNVVDTPHAATALVHACRSVATDDARTRRRDAVMALLAAGADPVIVDETGRLALSHVAEQNDEDLVSAMAPMLTREALNRPSATFGRTPLHEAAEHASETVCASLMNAGADPSVRNVDQRTALHLAAWSGDAEKVGLFLARAPRLISQRDKFGKLPLHTASERGGAAAVQRLLDGGADPSARTGAEGRDETPAHLAAWCDAPDVVELLLARGGDVMARDGRGRTILHVAAKFGASRVAELLLGLPNKAEVIEALDQDGRDAFMCAASYNQPHLLRQLADAGSPVERLDRGGHTAFQLARHYGAVDAMETLKAIAPWVEWADQASTGQKLGADARLLTALVATDDFEGLAAELARGANPNAANQLGWTALHVACLNKNVAAARILLDAGADGALPHARGDAPLHVACYRGEAEIVSAILAKGVPATLEARKGRTPLQFAGNSGRLDALRVLLSAGAEVNHADAYGETALFWTCRTLPPGARTAEDADQRIACVRHLLEVGADAAHPSEALNTPLQVASREGLATIATLLVDAGAPAGFADRVGRTALHYSVQSGNDELISFLIQRGASVNQRDQDNQTPFYFACLNGNNFAVKTMLGYGADPSCITKRGWTALIAAVRARALPVVRTLTRSLNRDVIRAGAGPMGFTAMHELTFRTAWEEDGARRPIMEALIQGGCDIGVPNKENRNALHKACIAADDDFVALALDYADIAAINAAGKDGKTPLHDLEKALQPTRTEQERNSAIGIARMLLNAGADASRKDDNGRTALAALKACAEVDEPDAALRQLGMLLSELDLNDDDDKTAKPSPTALVPKRRAIVSGVLMIGTVVFYLTIAALVLMLLH